MTDKLARATLARMAVRLNRRSGHVLPALVLLTDDERLTNPVDAAMALPLGSMVVVRAKDPERREAIAERLAPATRARSLTLLIASDPALALRVGAHGVHFSEQWMHACAHWRACRPDWIITASAHSLASCSAAHRRGADAVFLAPIFPTQSHFGGGNIGLFRAMNIARLSPLPVYGLGGIDANSARRLSDARLVGLAAIGALKA